MTESYLTSTLRRLVVAGIALVATLTATAAVPTGYYSSLNGKSGQALKNAVHDLIAKHTVVDYSNMWTYYPSTDCYPDNKQHVWDMYSDNNYYYNGTRSVSGMNREHSFPKSWWGGSVVDAYTDLNHLYPADGDANMAKSNWPLGEVLTASFNNGVTKVGTPVNGQGGGAGTVFEPDDRYKGDFARTYFYMATCYQDYTWKYTYQVSNSSWLTLNDWSIKLLLKWARQDAVSDKETARNDAVYRIQNNRNPFIDNPELMEYIWGDKQGQVFNVDGGSETQGDPTLITPTQGTVLNFGEVALGKSVNLTVWIKGQDLTNALSLQLYRYDYQMFSIPVYSVDRTVANSADGYPLTITYTPTALGSHKAKLLVSDGGLVGSVGVELNGVCKPVPSLSAVTAQPAREITDSSYVACWTASTDTVDYYEVTRTVYDNNGSILSSDVMRSEETSYLFNDRHAGETHAYSVHACRLGYTSPESNIITLDASGITGVEASRPVSFIAVDGGVLVKCGEPLTAVRVFTASGVLVATYATLQNDDYILLPGGVYVVTAGNSRQPAKLVIK